MTDNSIRPKKSTLWGNSKKTPQHASQVATLLLEDYVAYRNHETRPGQLHMAQAVAQTMANQSALMIEAPTGSGKSLAYLIGALAAGHKTMIAPHTIALQKQLVDDVESFAAFCIKQGSTPPTATLLKGKSNYLCLSKLENMSRDRSSWLEAIRQWSTQTHTGDKDEAPLAENDASHWKQVSSTSDECMGLKCPLFDACFHTQAKIKAANADIVVVNQKLLSIAMLNNTVIPADIKAVVVDEAHEFASTVSDTFGAEMSLPATLNSLEAMFEQLQALNQPRNLFADASDTCLELRNLAIELFTGKESRTADLQPYMPLLKQLRSMLNVAVRDIEDLQADWPELLERQPFQHAVRRIRGLHHSIRTICEGRNAVQTVWLEQKLDARKMPYYVFHAAAFDVSTIIANNLLSNYPATTFTSATLRIASDFAIPIQRNGFNQADTGYSTSVVPSTFKFPECTGLWQPAGMPSPNDFKQKAQYAQAVANVVHTVAKPLLGRTMLLCTASASIAQYHALLQPMLQPLGITVMAQGLTHQSATKLRQDFIDTPHAVLIGTKSFWAGISIEGDHCMAVVIDKIPFKNQKEPIIQARIDHAEASGQSGFNTVQVADATTELVQGFGRLNRTINDRGLVALCDPRLNNQDPQGKGYARQILSSLPRTVPITNEQHAIAWLQACLGLAA